MKQFLDFKKLLDFYKNKQLLVFGYGSLMWNPDFEYQSSEVFNLQSFYRDFCVFSTHYRGTEEKPGLVLGLRKEDNRNCIGKLFVVAEEKKEEVLSRLWEREMLGDIYIPTVLSFHKKTLAKNLAGEIFTFVANSQSVKVFIFIKKISFFKIQKEMFHGLIKTNLATALLLQVKFQK